MPRGAGSFGSSASISSSARAAKVPLATAPLRLNFWTPACRPLPSLSDNLVPPPADRKCRFDCRRPGARGDFAPHRGQRRGVIENDLASPPLHSQLFPQRLQVDGHGCCPPAAI